MQNKSRHSVTIGIPTYNNADNIIYLLRSILKQKGDSFSIDEILVISDGSTDSTAQKVTKYSEKYPIVKLYRGTKRRGKVVRLHQIFSLVKSKYTFIFDGDVILFKGDVLDTMVKAIRTSDTGLVSADMEPLAVKGLKANIIKSWYRLLYQIRKNINQGNNVYNFRGGAFGIDINLAQNIVFPKAVHSESPYLYFVSKAHNLKFKFVYQAKILFHTPLSFTEYIKQSKNAAQEKKTLVSIFGEEAYQEFHIPFQTQFKNLTISILKNPLNVIIMMLFAILKIVPYKSEKKAQDNVWSVIPSSKRKAHSY